MKAEARDRVNSAARNRSKSQCHERATSWADQEAHCNRLTDDSEQAIRRNNLSLRPAFWVVGQFVDQDWLQRLAAWRQQRFYRSHGFYRASICEGGLGSRNSVCLSVRPSVCLSHAWIVKKLNDALHIFLYHTKGQSLCYLNTNSGWWAMLPSLWNLRSKWPTPLRKTPTSTDLSS